MSIMNDTGEIDQFAEWKAAQQRRMADVSKIRTSLKARGPQRISLDPDQRGRIKALSEADKVALVNESAAWLEDQEIEATTTPTTTAERNVRVATAYADSDWPIPNDDSRQGALFASTVIGVRALAGNPKAVEAFKTAMVRAMAAVSAVAQPEDTDLVLRLESMLRKRRPDLPAGICALIAYHVAGAVDPTYGPLDDDQDKALDALQSRRFRAARKAKAQAHAADPHWVYFMTPAA